MYAMYNTYKKWYKLRKLYVFVLINSPMTHDAYKASMILLIEDWICKEIQLWQTTNTQSCEIFATLRLHSGDCFIQDQVSIYFPEK